MRLDGETALVTGASRGIGAAIAGALLSHGARVVGTATGASGCDAFLRSAEAISSSGISSSGDQARAEVLDVADTASVTGLFERLARDDWMPSVLVNNAGITRDGLLARMKDEDWHTVIETNLGSIFRLCKAASRSMMKARHGRIINIGSIVGDIGNAGQTNYAAAKSGMLGFTKSFAREVAGRGITVNAVAPGFIDTDMTRGLPDKVREELLTKIPMKRLGTPEDVAQTVVFLASSNAGYITGQSIAVNGGMQM